MSTDKDAVLAQKVRDLLLEDLGHIEGRIRSRLNLSRQAAVAAVGAPARPWLRWTLLPATGAVCAAALVMVFMLHTAPNPGIKPLEASNALDQVDDLVTDDDALDLVEGGDQGFYEWAAAQEGGAAGPGT